MTLERRSPAQRRHDRRVGIAMSIYMVAFFAAVGQRPGTPLAYAIALIPALAIVATFVAIGRYLIEESDEYLRSRMVRQIILATGLALTFASIWGFLEIAGLPHLHLYMVVVVWFLGLGLAAAYQCLGER